MRKLFLVFLLVGLQLVPATSASAASGVACEFRGQAHDITPGLTLTDQDFTLKLTGDLLDCMSDVEDAPVTGAVSAGNTRTVTLTNPDGEDEDVVFDEPTPTGSGSCASTTANGIGIVDWADGTTTVFGFAVTSVGTGVSLEGEVIDSVTLTSTFADGSTATTTITTDRYAGDGAAGLFTVEPTGDSDCGVTEDTGSVNLVGSLLFGSI